MLTIAALKESAKGEARVALTPETTRKYGALGAQLRVRSGAGLASAIGDTAYVEAGAHIADDDAALLDGADIVLSVRRPSAAILGRVKPASILVGCLDPGDGTDIDQLAKSGASAFAMELMPRITRAQAMDVLSSQANLAGYRAVLEAAAVFERAFPMMMTAAGTVPPARVFVMGAGVAGLQAIATARRLGAIVSATDVRPAAREQVESLGGKFIAVEDEESAAAETAGGYAVAMSQSYQEKQAALVRAHLARQDIVITTALIPGRPAPRLISRDMISILAPGSVVVDMAVEQGGNVEGIRRGAIVEHDGVKLVGFENLPSRLAASASALYARNLFAFVSTMINKETKALAIDWADELVSATLLTREGHIVHPAFFRPKG